MVIPLNLGRGREGSRGDSTSQSFHSIQILLQTQGGAHSFVTNTNGQGVRPYPLLLVHCMQNFPRHAVTSPEVFTLQTRRLRPTDTVRCHPSESLALGPRPLWQSRRLRDWLCVAVCPSLCFHRCRPAASLTCLLVHTAQASL